MDQSGISMLTILTSAAVGTLVGTGLTPRGLQSTPNGQVSIAATRLNHCKAPETARRTGKQAKITL